MLFSKGLLKKVGEKGLAPGSQTRAHHLSLLATPHSSHYWLPLSQEYSLRGENAGTDYYRHYIFDGFLGGILAHFLPSTVLFVYVFRQLAVRAVGGARGVPRSANARTGGFATPPTGPAAAPLDTAASGTLLVTHLLPNPHVFWNFLPLSYRVWSFGNWVRGLRFELIGNGVWIFFLDNFDDLILE